MERTTVRFTREGYLAVQPPTFKKIEAQVTGGIAIAGQKREVIKVKALMDYPKMNVNAGDQIIIAGDSGLQPWAKAVFSMYGMDDFVVMPEGAVIGVEQEF
jgi:hypothetical protein